MVDIFGGGLSREGYERYARGLANALKLRDFIADPSFALSQDPEIYEKVMRDPVAAHAIRYRRHLVAAQRVRVVPGGEDSQDIELASVVEALIDQIRGFTDARMRLADSVFRGSAWAFIEGSRAWRVVAGHAGAWWAPTRLIDVDRRRIARRRNRETGEVCDHIFDLDSRDWRPFDRRWFVSSIFDDREGSLGYGSGILDTLYYFQAEKALSLRLLSQACIRFGSGMVKAAIDNMRQGNAPPGKSSATVAAAWRTELARMSSENCLVHDKRDEVDLLTGIGEGRDLILDAIRYYDHSQVVAVLGATVQTMEGDGGSYALAREHANSTEALVQADRIRLGEDLTQDLVGAILRANAYQIRESGLGRAKRPTLEITQNRLEDPAQMATVISTALAAGIPLRADEVYSRLGFSQPGPDDEVIESAPAPSAPGALPGLGGFGLPGLG